MKKRRSKGGYPGSVGPIPPRPEGPGASVNLDPMEPRTDQLSEPISPAIEQAGPTERPGDQFGAANQGGGVP